MQNYYFNWNVMNSLHQCIIHHQHHTISQYSTVEAGCGRRGIPLHTYLHRRGQYINYITSPLFPSVTVTASHCLWDTELLCQLHLRLLFIKLGLSLMVKNKTSLFVPMMSGLICQHLYHINMSMSILFYFIYVSRDVLFSYLVGIGNIRTMSAIRVFRLACIYAMWVESLFVHFETKCQKWTWM